MESQEMYRVPGRKHAAISERHPDFAVLYLRVDPRLKADLEAMAHDMPIRRSRGRGVLLDT